MKEYEEALKPGRQQIGLWHLLKLYGYSNVGIDDIN
jgi:hypothetical protein